MQRWQLIQDCAARAFVLRLGDPTWGGLLLTALYVLASLLFLTLALRPRLWGPGERVLWTSTALLILALAVNKQLDVQQSVVWTSRCVARAEGWFDQRLVFQRAFGLGAMAILGLAAGALLWATRRAFASNPALLVGLFLLGLFLFLQISRFEQLAGSLGQTIVDFRLHRILEGLALITLIWAAWQRLRRAPA